MDIPYFGGLQISNMCQLRRIPCTWVIPDLNRHVSSSREVLWFNSGNCLVFLLSVVRVLHESYQVFERDERLLESILYSRAWPFDVQFGIFTATSSRERSGVIAVCGYATLKDGDKVFALEHAQENTSVRVQKSLQKPFIVCSSPLKVNQNKTIEFFGAPMKRRKANVGISDLSKRRACQS